MQLNALNLFLECHPTVGWPLQDVRSLRGSCALINPRLIALPTCFALTITILLHDY